MTSEFCESGRFEFVSYRDVELSFTGEISWINTPSDFYVNILHDSLWNKYMELMSEMQLYYKTNKSRCLAHEVTCGQLVAVLIENKTWMRGCVRKVYINGTADIMIIDSGYMGFNITRNNICLLNSYCPAQAIPVKMAFIGPINGSWHPNSVKYLADFLDMELPMKIYCAEPSKDDGRYNLAIFDMGSPNKCIATNCLVKDGYANYLEDDIMAKISVNI